MRSSGRLLAAAVGVALVMVAGAAVILAGGSPSATASPSSATASPAAPSAPVAPTPAAAASAAALLPGEFTACVPTNHDYQVGTNEPGVAGDMTVMRQRGFTWNGEITATDPRFTGTHYFSYDSNTYTLASGAAGPEAIGEGHRIEGADGAWQGGNVGVLLQDGTSAIGAAILTGEGAYAGLTAVLFKAEGSCFFNFRGFVIDVPAVPVPAHGG